MEKSRLLHLAYQMRSGGIMSHDHLVKVEAEVWCLREELEAS